MTPTFCAYDRRRHWLPVWNLAVVVFSAAVVDLSTAARPPTYRLNIGHNQLPRTHHQSSAAGAVPGGIRSNTVLQPSSAGGTVISSVGGGGDDSGKTTSSAYCRNNVNYHEDFVRSETGAPAGATKVEVFGAVLKSHVQALRRLPNRKVDLVFLVDSSSSVSEANFRNELKFVQRLLADFTVDRYTTRVAVVTFSSPNRVLKHVDYLTNARDENHKCSLLEEAMPKIPFMTGSTYTKGAMQEAEQVFRSARPDAKKVLFLITDGYSNGGDPKPIAESLRRDGVEIFTFGIKDGNFIELCDMASDVKHEHVYILNTFEEFEALARRALHEDLHIGNYVPLNNTKCDSLCRPAVAGGRSASLTGKAAAGCCDALASCACGTHTGKYECICQAGYYGSGLVGECLPCPEGTYKNYTGPGDRTTCYPCPDINHYSPTGSITESQCVCKRGYKAIKTASGTTACAVKTCPPIVLPANAYFVQGHCNNDVNAACGVRCKSGYHLIGTSLRLCTEDGVWNGTDVRCEVKHCPRIQAPSNGNMVCTKDDFSYDTQCHFTCNPGHKLVGTRVQSCLAFAMWSGIYPKCREMKCAPLPPLVDGRITPESCTSRESPFGTVCNLACNVGYKLNGVHRRQCTETGRWTPDDESLCIDVMPPTITCPANISVDAAKDESFGHVIWAIPGAYDNSGYLPTVTVVPALVPPVSLTIGQHTITYTAEDGNKNKGRCSFVVAIRDTQPPRVDRCVSPPPFVRRAADDVITWDEPLFSDNSHQPVNVSRSPGITEVFPIGTTQINYTAIDAFNNSMTCTIEIVVQEHACANHQVPSNGDLDCRSHLNGVECVPRCNAGYGFAFPPADKYYCDYDVGHWTPKDKWPVRDCSISSSTTTVRQKSFLRFRTNSACSGPLLLNQLESKFETIIQGKVKDYCSPNMICEVNQFTTSCTEENDLIEDEIHNSINILPVEFRSELQHSRRRRSYATSRGQNFIGVQHERDLYPGESTTNGTVVVEMEVTGRPGLDERLREDAGPMQREELVSGIGSIMDRIRQDAINGDFDSLLMESGITSVGVAFDPQQATFMCPQGSVMQGDACVTCPAGTFFNVVLETCAGCPRGSYQPQEGSLTCLECPDHTSTAQNNSKSINQCRGHCLPGSFSSNRVDPCETCPIGFYQPDYAQTSCVPCQPGMTTWRRGSWKPDDCGVLCPEGHVSKTGLEPCFPCPRGYFQPERGRSSCFVCPAGTKTRQVGSTDITDCDGLPESAASLQGHGIVDWRQDLGTGVPTTQLVINECFAEPCVNGATCHSVGVGFTCACLSGWTGLKCEVEVDECQSQPCLNNATCTDQFNGFNCTCPEGYTGAVCDVNIDECATMEPCLNNATCVDLLNAYRCECTVGFNGTQCEQNIDDCALDPCKNGGTCTDGVAEYSCHCLPGFQGVNCEVDVDECLSVKCQNNGTCVDSINSFHCQCKVGYAGDLCQLDIDECQSTPCLNNATCLNLEGRYSCQCPPSYGGIQCETKLNSSFDLVFRTPSITNYAALDGAIRGPLSALTVAMWLRTDDRDNQGTPLSYATSTQFNGWTLTDCSGFVLYIDGVESVTDVAVNDGRWHHVTVTWSGPTTGAWTIYVDGLPRENGTISGSGGGIEGGGILVVGQEQDALGGGFSSNEAFIGRLHAVNLWDYELSPAAVANLASECDDVTGNLVAWPDFVAGINGHVERVERDICQGCGLPPNISHSQYTLSGVMVNDTVSYTCDVGYKIDGPSRLQCQLTTYWVPANQSSSETVSISGDATPARQQPRCHKVVCGNPGDIANGRLYPSIYTYGTTLRFYCNTGYRLIESDQPVTCSANGTWSGSKPVCELITCPTINLTSTEPLSVDGNRTSGYRPGESAKFSCRRGFRLIGRQNVRCQDKGTWDTAFPVCDEIFCRIPPTIDNAQLVNSSSGEVLTNSTEVRSSVGNSITYRCVSGYKMAAGNSVRCGDDGRWANDRPRCIQVTCRQPDSVGNATSTRLNQPILPGSRVEFQCNVGFVVSGQFKITCTENGDWNSPSPRCLPVSCPPPGEILNGLVVGNEFTYGGKVKYSCFDGYVLDATGLIDGSARVCMETGNWNPSTEPVCRPRPCQTPEVIANGHIIGRTATSPVPVFGDRVEYKCDEGYRLEGQSIRTCLENGTLSDQAPDCVKIRCTAPVPIEHGAPVVVNELTSSYDPGSSIRYRCDHGYMIVGGRDTRTCRSDGTWAGPVPHCVDASCPLPSVDVDHHMSFDVQQPVQDVNSTEEEQNTIDDFIQTSFPIGSIVEYRCNAGYRLFDGKDSIQQICVDGIWNGPHPVCIRFDEDPSLMVACPAPNATVHGAIDRSDINFKVGSTVIFRCDAGYVLNGRGVETELTRTCLLSGAWSGEFPACQPIDCGEPPSVIPNGRAVATSNYTFQSAVNFVCDEGFHIAGDLPSSVTCKSDGLWTDPLPVCTMIECPPPLQPSNGAVSVDGGGNDFRYGRRIVYSCQPGFQLVGAEFRTCLGNRTWSGADTDEPRCVEVECPRPNDPDHGLVEIEQPRGLFFGGVAIFTCHNGYSLVGGGHVHRRHCGLDGNWSPTGEEPRCVKIVCGKPPKIDYGIPVDNEVYAGDEPRYSCDQGYQLIQPDPRFVCNAATGNYTGGQPHCQRIECPKPETVNDADIDAPGNALGDVVRYRCRAGFELVGSAELVCTETGAWSPLAPTCIPITCPAPEHVPDAIIYQQGYDFNSKITYSCIDGRLLESGSTERVCQADRTWSGEAPVCSLARCPTPKIDHGFVASSAGDGAIEPHVRDINRGFVAGVTIELDCEEGFRLAFSDNDTRGLTQQEATFTCLVNSTWSGRMPSCHRVRCPEPHVPNSVITAPKGFVFGFRVMFTCIEGYELVGSNLVACGATGNWTTPLPKCNLVFCDAPPPVDNSVSDISRPPSFNDSTTYVLGTTIIYSCRTGFRFVGPSASISCRSNRKWSAVFPSCQRVTCSPPLIEGDLAPEVTDPRDVYAYNDVITFRCGSEFDDVATAETRYQLVGVDRMWCNETGFWNGSVPECRPLICPPVQLQYGVLTSSTDSKSSSSSILHGLFVGTELTFKCNDGYRLAGNVTLTCTKSLTWSANLSSCIPVVCSPPVIVHGRTVKVGTNGNVDSNQLSDDGDNTIEYPVGTKVLIGCDTGYQLPPMAASASVCMESTSWSPDLPDCVPVTCPALNIEGGRITVNGNITVSLDDQLQTVYRYLDTVVVECLTGHTLTGQQSVQCESTGLWSGRVPSCERIRCPEPAVQNGTVRPIDVPFGVSGSFMFSFGVIVSITCDDGHLLVGIANNVCQDDGTWIDPFPVCEPVRCPSLVVPDAVVEVPDVPEFGASATVRCNVGYELFGDSILRCQATGRWSGITPLCLRVMCKLPAVANARIVRVNSTRHIQQQQQPLGTTSPAAATSAATPQHGYSYGEEIVVECVEGYELYNASSARLLTCGADKIWKPSLPSCRRRQCADPLLSNVTNLLYKITQPAGHNVTAAAVRRQFVFGTRIDFECNLGFRLNGSSTSMYCDVNGNWNSPTTSTNRQENVIVHQSSSNVGNFSRPSCVEVFCPMPAVEDGIVHKSTVMDVFAFGDQVKISCKSGFELVGDAELVCQPNAEWTPDLPSCVRRKCLSRPPIVESGYIVGQIPIPPDAARFGDVINYRCDAGYEIVGSENITCLADGRWSDRPTCLPVRCSPPETIRHGTYISSGFAYGSNVRYACNPGYELIGTADHECLANATWSGKAPACSRVQCPRPPHVPHAVLMGSEVNHNNTNSTYLFGDKLTVKCNTGYRLVGSASIDCLSTGSWSRVTASCKVIVCGDPPHVRLAQPISVTGNGRDFNSTMGYVCQAGYELDRPQARAVCQADGSWSDVDASCVRVRCSYPTIPDHVILNVDQKEARTAEELAKLRPDGFRYRDRVYVSCISGHETGPGSGGLLTMACGTDGRWNGTATSVQCSPVHCSQPPKHGHLAFANVGGSVTISRLSYPLGHTLEVRCDPGYKLSTGNDRLVTVTCQPDRSWNLTASVACQKVVCPTPGSMEHGTINGNSHDYGSRIEHVCSPGYVLVGDRYRKCGENGTWDSTTAALVAGVSSPPYCAVANCTLPDVPANGHVIATDGLSFGSVVRIRCRPGYQIAGSAALMCLADARWNSSVPTCQIITCPKPEIVDNADIVVNGPTTFESVVTYRCYKGYELRNNSGSGTLRCNENGTWSGTVPTCRRISCSKPEAIDNGYTRGSDLEYGATVLYACDAGYQLQGNNVRHCMADRTWNGSLPVCRRKQCPSPATPLHGKLIDFDNKESFTPGSQIEFGCEKGYRLNGSHVLVCTELETWADALPTCVPITCDQLPPSVTNADFISGTDIQSSVLLSASPPFNVGYVVRYVCRRGYRLFGPETVQCEVDGSWSSPSVRGGQSTSCQRVVCPEPPTVKHATPVATGRLASDLVYYVCDEGYDLTGNNLLECSLEARWTGTLPICEPITCGVVPVIPHATTIVHRTTLGSRATYECNRGFRLRGGAGSAVVECKANRTWTYAVRPACVPVDCGSPPQPSTSGTGLTYELTTFTSVATYYCLEGFRFADEEPGPTGNEIRDVTVMIRCGESGRWNSTEAPVCEKVTCPDPGPLLNGRHQLSGTGPDMRPTFGRDVKFTCNAGYQLNGSSIRTCQPDGSWSGQAPSCHLLYCDDPVSPANGNWSVTGRHFGSTVTFWCMPGYTMVGTATAVCGSNGKWSEETPDCVAESGGSKPACDPLPVFDNAQEVEGVFLVGDTVHVSCKPGFQSNVSGMLEVTCQDDLTWTEPRERCEKISCLPPRSDPMNVVIHGSGRYQFGDRAFYTCRQGLQPATVPIMTCTETGEWDHLPLCIASCKFPCQNGGTCVGGNRCQCPPGFGGRFCDAAICNLPCLNGGRCSGPYQCDCPPGFSGLRCEKPVCAKPCLNGGRCGFANRCICPHGFVPPFCEKHRFNGNHLQDEAAGRHNTSSKMPSADTEEKDQL